MNTATVTARQPLCALCRHDLTPATATDTGFGYFRELDTTDRPEPVPAGVDMHFFTGRTPRRAAA